MTTFNECISRFCKDEKSNLSWGESGMLGLLTLISWTQVKHPENNTLEEISSKLESLKTGEYCKTYGGSYYITIIDGIRAIIETPFTHIPKLISITKNTYAEDRLGQALIHWRLENG